MPALGVTVSHDPPLLVLAVAVQDIPAVLLFSAIRWGIELAAPAGIVKFKLDGVTEAKRPDAALILRTRLLEPSAISTLPNPSTDTPAHTSEAAVAGPPSPLNPEDPVPAKVETTPVGVIFRSFDEAQARTFPTESTAKPLATSGPEVAGPGSLKLPKVPLPAKVVMVPPDTLRMRLLESAI